MKSINRKLMLIIPLFLLMVGLAFNVKNTPQIMHAEEVVDNHNHDNMTKWTSTTSLPVNGNYYLVDDVTISSRVNVSGTLNLCLNGHGIRFTGTNPDNGSVFYVASGNTFNLYDCGTTEHRFKMAYPTLKSDLYDYENINCIAGFATVNDKLTEDYETFTGGYITGGIGSTTNQYYYYGGCVFVYGGTFNMYGGTIIGNTVRGKNDSGNDGAGVYVSPGRFTMYGGSILGNYVNPKVYNGFGGGVYVSAGTVNGTTTDSYFVMNGGIIERNVAATGGGIFVGSTLGDKAGHITTNGGEIRNNYAESDGGGILIQSGILDFNNCKISGNITSGYAGGIYFYPSSYSSSTIGSTFKMNNCEVFENVAYGSGGIEISSSINQNAKVEAMVGEIKNTRFHDNVSITSGGFIISGTSQVNNFPALRLTMQGCLVDHNYTIRGSNAGVVIKTNSSSYNGPKVFMSDCVITDNKSNYPYESDVKNGSGLRISTKSELHLSGKIVIKDNEFYTSQTNKTFVSNTVIYPYTNTLFIDDALTEDSYIGVSKYNSGQASSQDNGTGPITSGFFGKASIDNFHMEYDEFYLTIENDEVVSKAKARLIYDRNNAKGTTPKTDYVIPNVEKATIKDNGELVKEGFTFIGWNTSADGSGTLYKPGDEIDVEADLRLYAIFEHGSHDGIDFTPWTDELAEDQNGAGKTATNSLPSVAGDYYLSKNVVITSTWYAPEGETNLCLAGYGIRLQGNGSVIEVGSGSKLTIHNCDTTNKHYYTYPTNYYGLVSDLGLATTGGSIEGGYITGGSGKTVGTETRGGGLYVAAGGEASFLGGYIAGNTAGNGAAVYVETGAKFTLGGKSYIRYNETRGSASVVGGAGVYVAGEFIMTGGTIQSNYSLGNRAGGVMVVGGTCTFSGGAISGNYAKGKLGVGVYVDGDNSHLNIEGNVKILVNRDNTNNNYDTNMSDIYLGDKNFIYVTGELTGDSKSIGIYSTSSRVLTKTDEENLAYNNASIFFSNNNYMVIEENGQLALISNGTVASVTKNGTTNYYTSFATAISNWSDGTLKLFSDVSGTQINVNSGTRILDLNNHSITYTSGSVIIVSGGKLTIQDTSANKTRHYYNINKTGIASISSSETPYYFEGGYLTGGVATEARGGGLRVTGGEVVFTSGTIFACKAGWGGGLFTNNTSTTTITGSAAIIGCYSSGAYTSGGAIFCEGKGAVNMTGGSIRHNSAQYDGGGVRVCLVESNNVYFTMTGGEITGNYSGNDRGSGLGLDMADRIKIGGSAKIYGNDGSNLYLKNGGYVTVVEAFTDDALIFIKTQNMPSSGQDIKITDQWTNIMGKDADYKNIFKFFNDDYRIKKNKDGELVASVLHIHNWVYEFENDVLTATCNSADECDFDALTVTLSVEDKVYDGTPLTASIVASSDWLEANGLTPIGEITYSSNTNVGTHTASITIGEYTITKEFEITPFTDLVKVTITGHNNTLVYDGNEHEVKGFDASSNSNLYDVNMHFAFDGIDVTKRLNAGKTFMGLSTSMFTNTSENFTNVEFEVVDGFIEITPITDLVTVTITGHNNVSDYNGKNHIIEGYDAIVDSTLYDVTKCFIFTEVALAERMNVGTTFMNLTSDMFVNTSENFTNVEFEVVDGFQTINIVDAIITSLPMVNDVLADGEVHELVIQGEVIGGKLYYALVKDRNEVPDDSKYSTDLPTSDLAGYYYIWYKVISDENHNDLAPKALKMVYADPEWVTITGTLYLSEDESALSDVEIYICKGNEIVDVVISDENGDYTFIAEKGVYDLVAEKDISVETFLVQAFADGRQDIVISGTKTESRLEVNSESNEYASISVGGLNDEALAIRESEGLDKQTYVKLLMVVDKKEQEEAENAEAILDIVSNKTLDFFEIKLTKTIGEISEVVDETHNILEIVIPYAKMNRHNIVVYSYHEGLAKTFVEINLGDEAIDGSFSLDKENGYIHIYTTCFSTFAIGYTPHYKVDTTLSLGSFIGKVNITLTSIDRDNESYELKDVNADFISFEDIPMGSYMMSITWNDGVDNEISMPIYIGGSDSKFISDEDSEEVFENNQEQLSIPLAEEIEEQNLLFASVNIRQTENQQTYFALTKSEEENNLFTIKAKKQSKSKNNIERKRFDVLKNKETIIANQEIGFTDKN